MKKSMLTLSLLLAAGSLMAAPKPPVKHNPPKSTTSAPAAKTAPRLIELKGEVVSMDLKANTLTFKSDGQTSTLKVDAPATHELSSLKAGEQVSLTVRESSKGAREAITVIKPARA